MITAFLLTAHVFAATADPAAKPLVVSSLPFDSSHDQQAIFGALRGPLEQALGQPVRFEAGTTYDDVVQRLETGKVDLAFLGALSYVRARQAAHVHAILKAVRKGQGLYHGVIVIGGKSSVKDLQGLRGNKVAFADKNSTSGYLFPRLLFKKAGLDIDHDLTASFAGSHRAVVELVASGKVDAGACFAGADESLETPQALKTLARTTDIPGDPVVVRPDMPADLSKKLRQALIDLAQNKAATPFFNAAEIDGFVPASDADYDALAAVAAGSF